MTAAIDRAMRGLNARCRCLLAANVLVGSAGSPEALTFFTGDPERFDNRLLFSTHQAQEGVLLLRDFQPGSLSLGEGSAALHTVSPGIPCWRVEGSPSTGLRLRTWHPEGTSALPAQLTVRRVEPQPGGRRVVLSCTLRPRYGDVTLDRDGQAVFSLIAKSLSENPYLREASRAALNTLLAPLEALLGTRQAVLAHLTATPEATARVAALRAQVAENTAAIRAVIDQPGLSPRERSSRINTLNHARHLLKSALRSATESLEQQALEAELGFYENHPNHWLVWLQPAIDELKAQLGLTQADPGNLMAHLSTRIRTARSQQDGVARAEDRYLDKLLAESRARRDHSRRQADPRDAQPFETPAVWTQAVCPIRCQPLSQGLAAIPFVADRGDLTSGNLMAGGQNVDRMPIDAGPLLSLAAVRELMWGELGQMASPYSSAGAWYNAAIPVHLGPASNESMHDLERAIGWLCTGTSAFGPQMAEAIPATLAALLGAPIDAPGDAAARRDQVQAILRTSALLPRYRSYPYVAGTAVFDESRPKQSLSQVWAHSVEQAAGVACLQNMGCITSLFARAVAADQVTPEFVAEDLFAWACRNIARSVLAAPDADGSGGVEGLLRLAALFHHRIELHGFPLADAPAAEAATQSPPQSWPKNSTDSSTENPTDHPVPPGEGVLDARALAWVLGPLADRIALAAPLPLPQFTDRLNALLTQLAPEQIRGVLDELGPVFARLDTLQRAPEPEPTPASTAPPSADSAAPPPLRTAQTHAGFDDLHALESLRPRRFSTPPPQLASPLAAIRRMTKAGETRFIPPADAALPAGALNPSALSWLESHTALYPLRAWLRLADAGLVGQPALSALRASPERRHPAPLPRVLPRLAQLLGGMDAVVLILRRSFAFVAANAFSYADNQWATTPLRTADAAAVAQVLGPVPQPKDAPRAYTAADGLDLRPLPDRYWPKLDDNGYLPKSRAIDGQGRAILPPVRLRREDLVGDNRLVCGRATTALIERLTACGDFIIGGLHRASRQTLGEHPVDLSTRSAEETRRVILQVLLPIVAGRVRGDAQHPQFFPACATTLYQLVLLGGDTRRFKAAEPDKLLAAEAAEVRGRGAAE
jgi:hypothetical protein